MRGTKIGSEFDRAAWPKAGDCAANQSALEVKVARAGTTSRPANQSESGGIETIQIKNCTLLLVLSSISLARLYFRARAERF